MGKEKVTIKDIAKRAGVSIATVSHVINRTRYVSPELEKKVRDIIEETGYSEKVARKEKKLKIGRNSTVVGVFPNLASALFCDIIAVLKRRINQYGYQFVVATTEDNLQEEKQLLDSFLIDKTVAGILYVPVSDVAENYKNLIASGMPFVCMERNILGKGIDSVVFEDRTALYKGTSYLLECGHKNLLFLREKSESTTKEERTRGYLEALKKININENDASIVDVDLSMEEDGCQQCIQRALKRVMPTAVIAGGNRLTLHLLKAMRNMGVRCPDDLSVVGFGDEKWMELMDPPLTTLERDVEDLSVRAARMLFEKMQTGRVVTANGYAEIRLNIRKSVKMLDNGPFGDTAVPPDWIVLSREERKRLRNGHYRVAISFHYTGTAWAELHEKGIRDELERYGIDVISVTDAHFDSALQNAQLEGILLQKPDAVIAVPTDDAKTAEKFQELSKVSKLVFISNVPENIGKNSYVACVSVNEWENGTNAGRMIGEYFQGCEKPEVGFIIHGATFYGTRARDMAAEKILKDNYPNVEIVTSRGFGQIENAGQVCRDMILSHPEIQALYVSWDRPALLAIQALKALGREDIAVFTTDLDHEIAGYMEAGIVKGMSTQRPYEQGQAAALVAAKSLVGDAVPKYVGVQPYIVEAKELRRAWKEIFHESMPGNLY